MDVGDVTTALNRWRAGEDEGMDGVMQLVYGELHHLCARHLHREHNSLSPTDLLHTLYLKLREIPGSGEAWESRTQFYAFVAGHVRRALVDHARRRGAIKRGGEVVFVELPSNPPAQMSTTVDVLAIHEALDALAEKRPDHARIVELRYFAGLSEHEVAEAMKIGRATVQRYWRFARHWLAQFLEGTPP